MAGEQDFLQLLGLLQQILPAPGSGGQIDEAGLAQLVEMLATKGDADPKTFKELIGQESSTLSKIAPQSLIKDSLQTLPVPASSIVSGPAIGTQTGLASGTPPFVPPPPTPAPPASPAVDPIVATLAKLGQAIQPAPVPEFTPPPPISVGTPAGIGQLGSGGIDLQQLIAAVIGQNVPALPQSFGSQLLGR
jgi:hypothetical protein